MENSVMLARFMGPYIIVIGIGMLFNLNAYRKIMEDFFKNAALVYVTGLLTFVAGLAIVLFHNIWILEWRLIITLFGWSILIKGSWLIIFPGTAAKLTDKFVKNVKLVLIPWTIMLALGLVLIIKGYY